MSSSRTPRPSRRVRVLNVFSIVFLGLGLCIAITAIAMYFGEEIRAALVAAGIAAGILSVSGFFWWLAQRELDAGRDPRESRWSRSRSKKELLLLTPFCVGMLVYQLGIGWIWSITIVLATTILALAMMLDFSTVYVPGDLLSIMRPDGFFHAALVVSAREATEGRGRIYELLIFKRPWRERPNELDLELLAIERQDGACQQLRLPTLDLIDSKALVCIPAHATPLELRAAA